MEFLAGLGALVVFGSLWFWIVFCVLSVAIIFFDEQDSPVWAGAALVGFLILMKASGVLGSGGTGIVGTIVIILLFIVCGVVWSVCKWWFHNLRIRDQLSKYRAKFVNMDKDAQMMKVSPNIEDPMPQPVRGHFRAYLGDNGYWTHNSYGWKDGSSVQTASLIPSAANHKGKIIRWMCFWPWSMAWTLLNDPLRRLFNHIFAYMKKTYQRMAEKVFGNVSKDM